MNNEMSETVVDVVALYQCPLNDRKHSNTFHFATLGQAERWQISIDACKVGLSVLTDKCDEGSLQDAIMAHGIWCSMLKCVGEKYGNGYIPMDLRLGANELHRNVSGSVIDFGEERGYMQDSDDDFINETIVLPSYLDQQHGNDDGTATTEELSDEDSISQDSCS